MALILAGVVCRAGPVQADSRGMTVVDGKSPAEYIQSQTGNSWAVVIGIDSYLDPKVPRLKYAVADARAVAKELERRGYQVTMLLNEQATERAINTELRARLRQRIGKDDRVVVYYAGHGQDDKLEGSRTMGYLLPVDGELDNIPGTGISMGVIKELADALPAKHVLFLMDACYGGVAGQQTRGLPKINEAYVRQITKERGRQLITAGGADQEAMEASDGGHGLFTAYLLKGLAEGLADLNGDGIIPASELYAYLDNRVFSEAQMRGHQQRPEIWTLSAEKGEFVFFTAPQPVTSVAGSGASVSAAEVKSELAPVRSQGRSQSQRMMPHAEESSTDSLVGFYTGLGKDGSYAGAGTWISGQAGTRISRDYLYLLSDGTFYEGFVGSGYDGFDLAALLKNVGPFVAGRDSGRYTVHGNQVTFQYGNGTNKTVVRDGDELRFAASLFRQPNCDGLKLSGTYKTDTFNMTITFTPDGRFVDRGVMPTFANPLLGSPSIPPGPGTYSIKNHTLTLRYGSGHVLRLFFFAEWDGQGGVNTNVLHIVISDLRRQGGAPDMKNTQATSDLPKIGVPLGWKIQRDGTNTKVTYVVPGDVPPGQDVKVLIDEAAPLPSGNAELMGSPGRMHDAIVQFVVNRFTGSNVRVNKAFTRDGQHKLLSSTGQLIETNGKQYWATIFTPTSSTSFTVLMYMADREDLYKAYLPTVRAMVGEGDTSLQTGMTSLEVLLSKMRTDIKVLNGWSSEYNPKEENTQFMAPNLSPGQIVLIVVGDREKLASSLLQIHEEGVRKTLGDVERDNVRVEEMTKPEQRENAVFSAARLVHPNGMRLWMTLGTKAVGNEVQGVGLITSSEELHRQHRSTLRSTLAEVTGQ